MAGTIIADFIRTDANQLSLNVGNTTFATINASGFLSNTGTTIIAANGQISGASIIASSIPTAAIVDASITNAKLSLSANDSNIKTALNASGNPGIYAARAWVNFNGSGTVAIRGSGNVSSITDSAIGSYAVNLTTAMPDTNFGISISSDTNTSGGINADFSGIVSTSSVTAYTYSIAGGGAGAYRDTAWVFVTIFR